MASQPTLKVKLVKCPKCLKVLPVIAELRVYKCGGCGTLLQAKSQSNSTDTGTGLHEASTSRNKELEDEAEYLPYKIHPLEKKDCTGTGELGKWSSRQLEVVDSSYKDGKDEESDWNKHRDFVFEQVAPVKQSSEEKMDGIHNQNNSRDIDSLQLGITNLSSKDLRDENEENEMGDCRPGSHGHQNNEQPEVVNLSSLGGKNRTDYEELRECIREQQKYSDRVQHGLVLSHNEDNGNGINHHIPQGCNSEQIVDIIGEQHNLEIEDTSQKDQHDCGDCNEEWHEIVDRFVSQSGAANSEDEENSSGVGGDLSNGRWGGTSALAGITSEANLIEENDFSNRKMSTGSQETTVGLRVKIHAPADVFISSDSLLSSPSEQLELSQRSILDCGLDPYAATVYSDHSLEFSGNVGNASNSLAIRRSLVFDEGAYHYDRTHNQQYYRHSQPLQVTNELPDFGLSNRRIGMNRQPEKPIKYRSAELQGLARSSTSQHKKPDTTKNSRSSQIYTEPTRHLHPVMNWDRSGSEQYSFEVPLHQENPLVGCESGDMPNLCQQDFGQDLSYPSARLEGIKQEKEELLRTVYELEDQLNETRYLKGVSREIPTEVARKEMSPYYNKEATEGFFHDLNCARSPERCMGESRTSKGQKFSRIPYSGVVTNSKQWIDHGSNDRPRNWRFSAPLPSCIPHQKLGLSERHLGYSPYSSSPPSRELYLDSNYTLKDSDLLSIDPTNEDCATKRRMKLELNPDKQHFLPTAGGAPFITCYSCLDLLQLPADLLLFEKKSVRLKCGSCSKLLKFSFQNKMHVVPYFGNINPSFLEVDSNCDINSEKNVALTSHSSQRVDTGPVSYSDDNRDFLLGSSSKEGEVLPTASYSLHGNASKQRLSYSAPLQPQRGQGKSVRRRSQKKYKDPVGTYSVSSPSTKSQYKNISPETKEFLLSAGSPLHTLMGYASPRHVIYGCETSPERTSSHYPATQD